MKSDRKFKTAYDSLPPKLRKTVRERLTRDVFMVDNRQTFYDKKNGKVPLTDYEWVKAKELFAEFGVNAETGLICQTVQS